MNKKTGRVKFIVLKHNISRNVDKDLEEKLGRE